MRLSEKTLELNICAQISSFLRGTAKPFWFGLTQKQEAVAGFDACAKLNGRLLVFQFKASNNVLKNGDRKFLAPHYQMSALSRVAGSAARSVFYAFPLIGNTLELKSNPNLLSQTWLLDVKQLSHLGPPTKSDGTWRKNGCHNVYVRKGSATVHSEPLETDLISMHEFVTAGFPGLDGFQWRFDGNAEAFWEFCSLLGPGARGMFTYD
ncbi:hypothetical protein NPJ88_017985 [Halomonas elongata]|uniref:hypothetical protein n=1 Tax=Halomonas elongata TaxID=2746 RepID=UPI00255B251A|nr:hypothetical protein [Halomonas elongata]MDL4864229.1 hypothetical protein [Halomonas elongata]